MFLFFPVLSPMLRAVTVNGEDIRRAREEMRLTQKDLAEAVGVSTKSVSNWERGQTVPRSRLGALLKFLRLEQRESRAGPPLSEASDLELVQELLTRLNKHGTRGNGFTLPDDEGFGMNVRNPDGD